MIKLFCPNCKRGLEEKNNGFFCLSCLFSLENKNGILITSNVGTEEHKEFYDDLYETEHGNRWFQGLNRASFLKRVVERISLSYRRERFFRKNIEGTDNLILDIACGAGRDYFKKFGTVVGVDLAIKPLAFAKDRYDLVIQSGATKLPFADETFDYILSSDFFGHIPAENKNEIIMEIWRVLKKDGKTLHIIETDSSNIWFKIAHRKPGLFQKYFIEKIGGHIGLELPNQCIERWEKNRFQTLKKIKIWGLFWPIRDYASLFDNEYKSDSFFLKTVVAISNTLGHFKVVEVVANIILNPISAVYEFFLPFNNGNGIMLVCKKIPEKL